MKYMKRNGQSGFSLVELMIVVGIIGVLATLALPRFKQFQSKAKMAEAQNVLAHVYTLEQSYSLDNNIFLVVGAYGANAASPTGNQCIPDVNALALGFSIEPCSTVATAPTPRFAYSVALPAAAGTFNAIALTGVGAANRVCPGNPQFNVVLNESNANSWGTGSTAGANPGAPPIGTVCPK